MMTDDKTLIYLTVRLNRYFEFRPDRLPAHIRQFLQEFYDMGAKAA